MEEGGQDTSSERADRHAHLEETPVGSGGDRLGRRQRDREGDEGHGRRRGGKVEGGGGGAGGRPGGKTLSRRGCDPTEPSRALVARERGSIGRGLRVEERKKRGEEQVG